MYPNRELIRSMRHGINIGMYVLWDKVYIYGVNILEIDGPSFHMEPTIAKDVAI